MLSLETTPLVAIVGRSNVGKSTLFNRLVGRRQAIVAATRGTTRDCVYGRTTWRGRAFRVVDTGGYEPGRIDDGVSRDVQRHLNRAIREADFVLMLCDAQQGVMPADAMAVDAMRKTGKPMALVANKAEHRLVVPPECYGFGMDAAFAISALHGRGIGDLLEHVVDRLPGAPLATMAAGSPMAVAIIGRPNVGKSSLFNALLREERVIVSDQPGTTRDAIDTHLVVRREPMTLIDTAGLKHRRKAKSPVEVFAMARAVEAIERCDVVLAVFDGVQGIVRDDQRLIEHVVCKGRGLVLLVNKWDIARRVSRPMLSASVHQQLPLAKFAPVLPICAKTGFGVSAACVKAREVFRAMRGVRERELSDYLRRIWARTPPPRYRGRPVSCRSMRWIADRPARVELLTTPAGKLPAGYQRFLLNRLAEWRPIAGVPVQLVVKEPPRRSS